MPRCRQFLFIFKLSLLSLFVYYSISSPLLLVLKRLIPSTDSLGHCRFQRNESFSSNLVYIPSLNILYCDVPKAASTNLRRFLYGYLKPSNSQVNLDRKQIWIDYEKSFRPFYLNENSSFTEINQKSNLFKFLFVRHPFRRIYSVFYDKFVHNHLDDTLFGWKQLEEDILLQMHTNETLLTIRRNEIKLDLRTFLLYIIYSIQNRKVINSHWQQIVERCGFCSIHYQWIGKVENLDENSKILVQKLTQYSTGTFQQFPSKEIHINQTSLNDEQLIRLFRETIANDDDFRVLIDYYQLDFVLFNYTLPRL